MHNEYEYFRTNSIKNGLQAWGSVNCTGIKFEKCNVRAYTERHGSIETVMINGVHLHPPRVV